MDRNFYKVTQTKITTSKNGYTIFNFQLNNNLWVSKLAPIRKLDKKYDTLYKIYEDNGSLDSLIGKYIVCSISKNNYGYELDYISSYDMVNDFKKLLDENNGKPFSTDMPIYDFLKLHKYIINADNSIRLNNPYYNYIVIKKDNVSICFIPNDKKNILTLENIELIYKNFFDGKYIDTNNDDLDCKYRLSHTAILKHCDRYHKYKSKTIRRYDSVVLELGDDLSNEQIEFLQKNHL